ncbi:hypothetical protein GWI34_30430 [Actinomadura sp. DSM 109109]|nr:hypothetical protein [Actinomadura lepetitiana]
MHDVIVVGAGPAGSAAGNHLARSVLDVLGLEKSAFPRERDCGDGLTPRAVQELRDLGVDLSGPGWFPNEGIRLATRHGLSHPALMRFALRLLDGLPAPASPTTSDRLAAALARLTRRREVAVRDPGPLKRKGST